MPRLTTGSVYKTAGGYGIRWPENGRRPHKAGFATKTEARRWFAANVAPRLDRGAPSPDITFDAFSEMFLARHGATVAARTRRTLEQRLAPARATFGGWTLAELEGAAEDIAAWRATLPEPSRHRHTAALRQTLAAGVRWRYLQRNPAVDAGRNPAPRREEVDPFTPDELAAIVAEFDPVNAVLVTFAAETGLRTHEWVATERRDLDRRDPAVAVVRRVVDGHLTPYPKTVRSRRRVPPHLPRPGGFRVAPGASGQPAAVPRPARRAHQPRQLAHPRLVPRPRRRRRPQTRSVPPAPHLRDRGARRGDAGVHAVPRDGLLGADDRDALRPSRPRLRAGR